jgi:hypothetical protein
MVDNSCGVLGSRERNKKEKKIQILINEFGLKLDQIHSLESMFFSLSISFS